MLRVTWRNLIARKVRLVLSAFAIVLGVGFVGGSMIFTDAMSGVFDDIIEGSTADAVVSYEGADAFESMPDNRTMPASMVDLLEGLPEVASAHPQNVLQTVFVIGDDGKVVGGSGPPGLAFNPTDAIALTGKPVLSIDEGRYPEAPFEVALDVDTAEEAGYDIGDTVMLATPGDPPTMEAELTGLVEFGGGATAGATITVFDTDFLQDQFFEGKDVFTTISLNAAPGVSQEELAAAAERVIPDDVVATTGDDAVARDKKSLEEIMGFLQTFLLVFAGVALVVGTFMIINTFSILVAQRSRELALLRALGASRRQVNGSVVLEALVVGVIGSTVGLGVGWLLAQLLRVLFGVIGLDLGRAEFPINADTVLWCFVVGIVVTLLAAIVPAVRASRIPPMAALRDDIALPEATLRRRVIIGFVLVALGAGAMVLGFAGEGSFGLSLLGLGILLVLVGVSLMSTFLGHPLLVLFGAAYRRVFGSVGALASGNTLRNPRRTGATASALMIGVTLMTMMSIFGASAKESTEASIGETLTSQFVISNAIGQPFSTAVADQVREIDGVAGVAQMREAYPEVEGSGWAITLAIDPTQLPFAYVVSPNDGAFAEFGPGTVAMTTAAANGLDVGIGDEVSMKFQAGTQKLRVVALYPAGTIPGDYLVTPDTFEKGGLTPLDARVFVTKDPDADTDEVRAELEEVVEDLPTVTVKDPEAYVEEQTQWIDQLLYMIYALLGLSVIIAVLGVVNTLGLSVIERTREIGLLRAVGLGRSQLRTMIRLESIVVAVFGALLGLGMGLVFGASIVWRLADQGLTDLAVPAGWLVVFLGAAALSGVLAAVFPARRAARLDVLRAIATE